VNTTATRKEDVNNDLKDLISICGKENYQNVEEARILHSKVNGKVHDD